MALLKGKWGVHTSCNPTNKTYLGEYVGEMELENRLNIIYRTKLGQLVPIWSSDVYLYKPNEAWK